MNNRLIKNQVSVIIPTYKRPDRIVRAVESALNQTCDTDVIVIDDNGKGTYEQLKTEGQLEAYKDRITYLVNETNLGPSGARNHGIRHATGEFITFLDDDDEISPAKLENQMNYLNKMGSDYSICYCDYTKLLQNGKTQTNGEHIEGIVNPYMLGRMIYVGSGSNILVRTSALREVGLFNESMRRYEDFELMCRLLDHYKLAYLQEDLLTIHYEVRDNPPSFEDITKYDQTFYDNVQYMIKKLPQTQQRLIHQTAALERWRFSLAYLPKLKSLSILKENQVSTGLFIRYLFYVLNRIVTKKSYGFKPF